MSTIERAIAIAAQAHAGQTDKAGAPYIFHPLRVMLSVQQPSDQIAAVLHDLIEDTDWTFDRLREEGFPEEIVEAVSCLTKLPEEEDAPDDTPEAKEARYRRFILRARKNPIARRVKEADLRDNMDLSRIEHPGERDYQRIEKYRKAIEYLNSDE